MSGPTHSLSIQANLRDNEGEELRDELRETKIEIS